MGMYVIEDRFEEEEEGMEEVKPTQDPSEGI
jgi:hypothetical protein